MVVRTPVVTAVLTSASVNTAVKLRRMYTPRKAQTRGRASRANRERPNILRLLLMEEFKVAPTLVNRC